MKPRNETGQKKKELLWCFKSEREKQREKGGPEGAELVAGCREEGRKRGR